MNPHDLAAEISDLAAAIAESESHGLSERASGLRQEVHVLERYRYFG